MGWRMDNVVRWLSNLRDSSRRVLASAPEMLAVYAGLAILIFGWRMTLGGTGAQLLTETMSRIAKWTGPLLSSSIGLGFAVMAFVQMLKPGIRVNVHRREITRWLRLDARRYEFPSYDTNPVLDNFLGRISLGRNPQAVLELPIEQLTAQILAAAEAALSRELPFDKLFDRPHFGEFMWLLLYPIYEDDAKERSGFDETQAPPLNEDTDPVTIRARERGRLSYAIQRRLDGLQIQVRYRWRRALRVTSLLVSLVLMSLIAISLNLWQDTQLGTVYVVLLLSALSTFFASVARDAVAVIERLRN
jgi:hypothetical protein